MSRTLNVVKMQLVNRMTFVWIPLIVFASTALLTYAIFAILRASGVQDVLMGGGAQAPMWYLFAVGWQSLTLTFPFSQAMGVARREFYAGTLITALLSAVGLGVAFVLLGLLEEATNGFGLNAAFARLPGLWDAGIPVAFAFIVTLSMLLFVLGFACATIFKRFGTFWLVATLLGLVALLVLAIWAISTADAWMSVWTWITAQGFSGMTGWLALVAVVVAALSFLPLRRAVP